MGACVGMTEVDYTRMTVSDPTGITKGLGKRLELRADVLARGQGVGLAFDGNLNRRYATRA